MLVKGEFDEIKLCDFGVTLPLDTDGTVSQEGGKNQYIGTEPWSAKEVIEEEAITTKVRHTTLSYYGKQIPNSS